MEIKSGIYSSVLPPLSTTELEALRCDIAQHGVLVPILVDEEGTILDGHHRFAIDPNAPFKVVSGLSEGEKLACTIRANQSRRNLSFEQKKELLVKQKEIAKQLRSEGMTQARVGEVLGVARSTVELWDTTNDRTVNSCIPDVRVKVSTQAKQEIFQRVVEEGESQTQVAADFGVTQQAVSKICNSVKKEKEHLEKRETPKEVANIDLRFGSFVEVLEDIEDGSVDLILTDPPYPYEFIECWSQLSEFASRKLKKHGFCIAYSGQLNLPEVMFRMANCLDYYWTFALTHAGKNQLISPRNLKCGWKPILVYQNGFKKTPGKPFVDVISGTGLEKDYHEWQQSEAELASIIDYFTYPGDVIVEPFAGSATTLIAASKMGRRAIGAELDRKHYNSAVERINNES